MRKLCSTIVSLLFIGSLAITASAQYLPYGYPSSSIPIKTFSYNEVWQPVMEESIENWNDSDSNIYFYTSNYSDNTVKAENLVQSWYGLNTAYYSGSSIIKFEIKINSRTIAEDATNVDNFIQSVFVHELGHSIWLADNPNTTKTSIMKYSRNRNAMTKPQPYDEDNVSNKY